jgi:hypothetical protein
MKKILFLLIFSISSLMAHEKVPQETIEKWASIFLHLDKEPNPEELAKKEEEYEKFLEGLNLSEQEKFGLTMEIIEAIMRQDNRVWNWNTGRWHEK